MARAGGDVETGTCRQHLGSLRAFSWTPTKTGTFSLYARATDGTGAVQRLATDAEWGNRIRHECRYNQYLISNRPRDKESRIFEFRMYRIPLHRLGK